MYSSRFTAGHVVLDGCSHFSVQLRRHLHGRHNQSSRAQQVVRQVQHLQHTNTAIQRRANEGGVNHNRNNINHPGHATLPVLMVIQAIRVTNTSTGVSLLVLGVLCTPPPLQHAHYTIGPPPGHPVAHHAGATR